MMTIQKVFLMVALAAVLAHPAVSQAQDPCLLCTVTAGSATVNVGQTFTIPISITNPSMVDLTSFQFSLAFGPTILQANVAGATAGSLLPGDWFFTSPGAVDNTSGNIVGVSAFGSAVSGSGVLANLSFQAIMLGASPRVLSDVFLNGLDQTSGFLVAPGLVTVL